MERMKVIAISGHARHGKDTVAQRWAYSFDNPLRRFVEIHM